MLSIENKKTRTMIAEPRRFARKCSPTSLSGHFIVAPFNGERPAPIVNEARNHVLSLSTAGIPEHEGDVELIFLVNIRLV